MSIDIKIDKYWKYTHVIVIARRNNIKSYVERQQKKVAINVEWGKAHPNNFDRCCFIAPFKRCNATPNHFDRVSFVLIFIFEYFVFGYVVYRNFMFVLFCQEYCFGSRHVCKYGVCL